MTDTGGSLSTILSPDGLGLSSTKVKSYRSNDRLFKYDTEDSEAKTASILASIEASDEQYSDSSEKSDNYRHDDTSVKDINWTVTIVANSIKVISAVLTILAVDQTERYIS